jgi:two-component system chemotaxis response regulator CheB
MIRVLVAEDSATARALLVEILRGDPDIEVVGEAGDGVEAVELTQKLRPQVVTMDIRMPRMDGFQATKEIMITAPTPIIVVTGSTRAREVEYAMHALRAGAVAVLAKPAGPRSPTLEEDARKLIDTVKAMAGVKVVRHWRPATPRAGPLPPPVPGRAGSVGQVVAVATSTGGPAALQRVLGGLPGEFPVPILVVQHITPGFTPGLVAWLNTVCDVQVKVAEHGEPLAPHTVYLPPDGWHLGVARVALGGSRRPAVLLSDAAPVAGFRPSGSFLFESVAQAFGPVTVAVMLTGMGEDGVEGLRHVRRAGGRILVQDEPTSVVFGMPGAVLQAGLADEILPLDDIAGRLMTLVSPSPLGGEGS